MAAPAYAAAGTYVTEATKDTTLTTTWPGGSPTSGHLAILQVAISDQGNGHTPPSFVESNLQGFRRLGPGLTASGFANTRSSQMRLYYKVLTGSDTAPTFQMTGGNGSGPLIGAVISTYSGDVGVIRLSTGNVGDASTITGTGITTKAAGGLVAAYSSASDDGALSSQAFTDPASPTERYDNETSARMALHLATGIRSAAGATGNFTGSLDETDPWCVMVLALEETEAFPSEDVLDTFTYSNGELDTVSGGLWVDDTFNFSNDGLSVSSNEANNSSALDERSYWADALAEGDGEVAAVLTALPGSGTQKVFLGYRIAGPDTAGVDGYELIIQEEGSALYGIYVERIDNKNYTNILSAQSTMASTDTIGVRYTGSTHEVYIKPTSGPRIHLRSVTDGTYTADGNVALGIKGTGARVTSFVAGPMVAPPVAPPAEFTPTTDVVHTGKVVVGIILPGAATSAIDLDVALQSSSPSGAGLATFGGGDIQHVQSFVLDGAGLITMDSDTEAVGPTPASDAGVITLGGGDVTLSGSFIAPRGRNLFDEQLPAAGVGDERLD